MLKASIIPKNISFRSLFIGLIGLGITLLFVRGSNHENFIYDIFLGFVSLIALTLWVMVIIKDLRDYKTTNKKNSFIPTAVGLIFVISLFLTIHFLNLRDKSPTKLFIVCKIIDFNGVSIDFRENGTYKLTSWALFYAEYYRGTYMIEDSIIILDKSKIENTIKSNRLVIRPEMKIYDNDSTPSKDTIYVKSVYQIDENGNIIKNATAFDVRKEY
ncbi:MAG: hypothetical protein PHI32_10650 [Dysgonamonadaceae bacterium]|nr:hypothetical protein [Dysgonamonadaceae bacterium]